jgi:hypothetical protein
MSISVPDEKMDDYARDCVMRLANRVDDKVAAIEVCSAFILVVGSVTAVSPINARAQQLLNRCIV